VLKNVS